MATMYYENDADMSLLEGKTVGIIGYGSQGHAHALNLHESGVNVMVGLYEGSQSWPKAEAEGLKVGTAEDVARESDIIMIDPSVSGGRAVIKGTRIAIEVVAERYKAGESIRDLAEDYGRNSDEIEEAIRCELTIAA